MNFYSIFLGVTDWKDRRDDEDRYTLLFNVVQRGSVMYVVVLFVFIHVDSCIDKGLDMAFSIHYNKHITNPDTM